MLLSLPEELQTQVLEWLALPGHKWSDSDDWPQGDIVPEHLASLSKVCLVSKNLHRLAWPILYQAFTNAELRDRHSQTPKLEPSLFLRTICLKPEYGLALRSLSIDLGTALEAMDASEVFELLQGDATLAALFQWKVRSFWFGDFEDEDEDDSASTNSNELPAEDEDQDDSASTDSNELPAEDDIASLLIRSLNMQLPEAQMAVLLLLCPRMKELHIRPGLSRESTITAKVLRSMLKAAVSADYRAANLPRIPRDFEQEESDYIVTQMFGSPWPDQRMQKLPTLQHLVKLSTYGNMMPGGSGVASFKNLLIALPSLRTLELVQLHGDSQDAPAGTSLAVPDSQLEKLSLLESELDSSDMVEIITCCPNLTELELDWLTGFERYSIRLGEIADALPICVPKLMQLKISSAQMICHKESSEHPYTIGTALTQLSHLTYLELDHSAIYGPQDSGPSTSGRQLSELLPKSIEYLEIGPNDFRGELGDAIQPVDAWEEWQIDDLNHLLQDESFGRLRDLYLELDGSSARRHIYPDTMLKHGWRVFEDNPENWVFRIENPIRV